MRRGQITRELYVGVRPLAAITLLLSLLLSAPAAGQPSSYVLGPGDVLETSVWGYPDLTRQVIVGPDGKITVPLAGVVSTVSATIESLTAVLSQAYAVYILEPQVTVIIKEFRKARVSLLGQVVRPGSYELQSGATILEFIAAAGGLTESAALKGAQLVRPGHKGVSVDLARVLAGDPTVNVAVKGGETLVVAEDLENLVSVQGEVAHPGKYRLKGETRVLDALLLAGGLTDRASVTKASLVRASGESQPLSLNNLLLQQEMQHNIVLEPGDKLFIPEETNNKIYVVGDVKNPGVFTVKGEVTILQALAMAGGPEQRGAGTASAAYVVRRSNSQEGVQAGIARAEPLPQHGTLITANLTALMKDPSKDVPVQAGDVLVLPQTGLGGFQVIVNILAGFASLLWPFR